MIIKRTIFTALIAIIGTSLYAQDACISGKVWDALSGDPVPFSNLQLMQDGAILKTTRANAEGVYHFPSLEDGMYEVVAKADAFPCLQMTNVPVNGSSIVIDLYFDGPSYSLDTLVQEYELPKIKKPRRSKK